MKRMICIVAGSLLSVSLFGCNVRQVPLPTINVSPIMTQAAPTYPDVTMVPPTGSPIPTPGSTSYVP